MASKREEIDEILVDCHDEEEQTAAWEVAFMDDVAVPFQATLLGMPVEVQGFAQTTRTPSSVGLCETRSSAG